MLVSALLWLLLLLLHDVSRHERVSCVYRAEAYMVMQCVSVVNRGRDEINVVPRILSRRSCGWLKCY